MLTHCAGEPGIRTFFHAKGASGVANGTLSFSSARSTNPDSSNSPRRQGRRRLAGSVELGAPSESGDKALNSYSTLRARCSTLSQQHAGHGKVGDGADGDWDSVR